MTLKNITLAAIVLCGTMNLLALIFHGITFIIFTFVLVVLIILTMVTIRAERKFEDDIFN